MADARPQMLSETSLVRSIGPVQLTLYALGSMIGSGIYGLIGKAAGEAGNAVWLAFLVALCAALLTALSYASLGSRYPRAGGAAYATQRAFGVPLFSFVIGIALICSGLTSVATQSKIFAANISQLLGLEAMPPSALAFGFLLVLTGIVFRGIRESMWVNVVSTLIEATGLLIVIAAGMSYWGSIDYFETPPERAGDGLGLIVLQASVLTFFAFIGFEDAINVAEECKNPSRTIPIGLAFATGIAAILYITISVTAVSVVPWRELSVAPSPLTEVMRRAAPGFPAWVMTAITLFSVANTALVNYITASRLIYGMARQGLLPRRLSSVHEARATPHVAISLLFMALVPLVMVGSISDLAVATVLLLLLVFMTVNAALVVLKRRRDEPAGAFEVPAIMPLTGFAVCALLFLTRLASSDWVAPALAGVMIAAAIVLYAMLKPTLTDAGQA